MDGNTIVGLIDLIDGWMDGSTVNILHIPQGRKGAKNDYDSFFFIQVTIHCGAACKQ